MNDVDRILFKLDNVGKTATETKVEVIELRRQSEKQFDLIRATEAQTNVNMADIGNLKQHRNGRNGFRWLVRLILGSV